MTALRGERRRAGRPVPALLPPETAVFKVPAGLHKIFERDLALAGIPKYDQRGRVADVHALRHSCGSHLSRQGVAPRTAQATLRHSTLDLTMRVYTDPALLDVRRALDTLPDLPLSRRGAEHAKQATGTDGMASFTGQLAPMLAPTGVQSSQGRRSVDKNRQDRGRQREGVGTAQKAAREPLEAEVGVEEVVGAAGFEPATSSPPC